MQYGKRLETVTTSDSGVTLKFEDGSEEKGSIVIGCDGGKSKVRVFLVGPEAAECKENGLSMINLQYKYTAEQALHLRTIHPTFKAAYLANFMDALASTLPLCFIKMNRTELIFLSSRCSRQRCPRNLDISNCHELERSAIRPRLERRSS